MRIIGPANTSGDWTIQRLIHEDGQVRFHTGKPLDTHRWIRDAFGRGYEHDPNATHNGMRIEIRANQIVEGVFTLDGRNLVDRDTGYVYLVSQSTLYDMLAALRDGHLRFEDGGIAGRFSFKCFSGKIFFAPAPANRAR